MANLFFLWSLLSAPLNVEGYVFILVCLLVCEQHYMKRTNEFSWNFQDRFDIILLWQCCNEYNPNQNTIFLIDNFFKMSSAKYWRYLSYWCVKYIYYISCFHLWFHHALPGQRRLPRSQLPFDWQVTTVFPMLLLPRGVLPLTQPNVKVWLKVRSAFENVAKVVLRSLPGATELSKKGQIISATSL